MRFFNSGKIVVIKCRRGIMVKVIKYNCIDYMINLCNVLMFEELHFMVSHINKTITVSYKVGQEVLLEKLLENISNTCDCK